MQVSRLFPSRGPRNISKTVRSYRSAVIFMDNNPTAFPLHPGNSICDLNPVEALNAPSKKDPSSCERIATTEDDLKVVAQSFQEVSIFNTPSSSPGPRIANNLQLSRKLHIGSPNMSAREVRDAKVNPSKASGGIPNPTAAYLAASSVLPQPLQDPQHLLVVIDLNGTLLFRPSRKQPTKFVARPNTKRFLKYCIDTFTVVIWSSARPENVNHMCDAILTPDLRKRVTAIWGRDKFGLSAQDFSLRVQCYKRLTKLWSDKQVAQSHPAYHLGRRWDQTNTVLVDDSLEKGRSEPYNLIEIPEFFGNVQETGEILPQVHDYLNHLSMHSNVSAYLRARPFIAQQAPAGRP